MRQLCPASGSAWCSKCYANLRGRAAYKGHAAYHPGNTTTKRNDTMFVKKVKHIPKDVRVVVNSEEDSILCKYPALREYLFATSLDDGTPRETATLLICSDQGRLKGWLNDRDNLRAAWVSADSLEGILGVLEAGLAEEGLEWRAQVPAGKRRK